MEFPLPLAIRNKPAHCICFQPERYMYTYCVNESTISSGVILMRSLYMLSISNPDLTNKIYWCLFYDPLNFIWAHIHVLFMAMKTYFHDPWNSGLVSFQVPWQFHGLEIGWFMFHDPLNWNLVIREFSWPWKQIFMTH